MRYSITTGLVLAALSISTSVASPTHAHLHRKAHEKKDVDVNWDNLGIDWTKAWAEGQKTATTAAPSTTAVSVAATTTSAEATATAAVFKEKTVSSANSIVDDVEDLWEGLVGAANDATSFGASRILGGGSAGGAGLAGDFENGNIGLPYGTNMIKAASTSGYDFTITFVNTQSKAISINIWNKGGPDLQPLSGASLAPKQTSLTFTIPVGGSQIVAFDDVSYIAFAEPCTQTSISGSYATTWGEVKFQSTGGGYDVSAIMNANGNDYDMAMSSEEVSCVSDKTQNMWLTDTTPVGGSNGSCYVPQSTLHLTVKMGGRS